MLSDVDQDTLHESVLFKSLPVELADELTAASNVVKFDRGETLFIQGDRAEFMFVILEGWVKLTRITPSGDEIVVTVYTDGQSFGEAAALQKEDFPVSATAVTDCRLLKVRSDLVLRTIQSQPEVALAIIISTFHHLHEFVLQIEEMKALSSVERLASFLMGLAPVQEGSCTFSLPYDKGLIAGRLGMKPESLSRAFHRLRQVGVVVSRNNVAISDVDRLHDFIEREKGVNWLQILHP